MSRRRGLAALVAAAVAVAAAGAWAAPPRDLAASLAVLARQALAAGDLATAEERFERILEAAPDSVAGRVGLARVALARGDDARARTLLDEAMARDADDPDALRWSGELDAREGRAERARERLERAVGLAPGRADLHHALAVQVGPAPSPPPREPDAALRRARAHPYDPRARLHAGRLLAAAGRPEEAAAQLEWAVWMADQAPRAGLAAGALLRELAPDWRERLLVPVHCLADEDLRRHPHWRMRLRLLLRRASRSLAPALDVALVPVSMRPFRSADVGDGLDAIQEALVRTAGPLPADGILAGFTGRTPSRARRRGRMGEAEFLGRRLLVRLPPEAETSPVFLHELLHLYGAVHVSPEVDSLMSADVRDAERALDPPNLRIVRATRERRFGPGGVEANVLPYVDLEETSTAYAGALRVNLAFRRVGLHEALEAGRSSGVTGAVRARRAMRLDAHLGDVSRFAGMLLERQERFAEAARAWEIAGALYGPRTGRGRDAESRAAELRRLIPPPSDRE